MVSKDRDTLKIGRHPDFQLSEYREAIGIKNEHSEASFDLLPGFKSDCISYYITSDKIIRTPRQTAETWVISIKLICQLNQQKLFKA